ncbi:hypothetical protein CRU94_00750 [Arcobacter sp. AHV-9/2010]|uniref:hypothetical protein n=1 Tax=Arcobacter sp. AHV-9/2010 TaxID=2021861 RepID=UPI00100BB550|nr:hypothetical protein [Arcobacter sp. CECT 9299]RXJ96675.1 hypothetical protein CRU94_00750 [Arcobacter sp. CECT 9299]
MINILKIVALGVAGFALLVYLTAPKEFLERKNINVELNYSNLPLYQDIVGGDSNTKKEKIFKDFPIYLVVLNHDSLAVFKDLEKISDKNIVFVANISNTPWLIKKMAVEGELEKLYKDSKISLINDSNGEFVKALGLKDNSMNSYFVYKINKDLTIDYIFSKKVKMGALQDGISEDEIKVEIIEFLNELNKY